MNCMEKIFPETEFGGFDRYDSTISFYLRVNALLNSSDVILDVGCGRGAYQEDPVDLRRNLRILRGKVQKVTGIDLDPVASINPFIDECHILDNPSTVWPVSEESINLVVSDWTLEHVNNPGAFFGELARVIKPGGYFCARTTNSWGYVALASKLIPEKFHTKVIQKAQKLRKEEDTFPTHYACNSIPFIRKMLSQYGFDGVVFGYSGLPAYLNFSCFVYYLGYLYERFMPQHFRHILMVFARKNG